MSDMQIQRVLVVGAGVMGRQIALQCATSGFETTLQDISEDGLAEARKFTRTYLEGRLAKGKMTPDRAEKAVALLGFESQLEAVAARADIVIEAIVERAEPKAELFGRLASTVPGHTILATNSSNIRASRLAEGTTVADRLLNLHFFNPALVMELVEVVAHEAVSESTISRSMEFCRAIGKTPVLMRREIPGFIVNRIFRALTREAMSLYEEGYASAEDIDIAVRKGLGHPLGPLELLDMTGLDVSYLARQDEFEETGVAAARPNAILEKLYREGKWGRKSGKGFYDYPPK